MRPNWKVSFRSGRKLLFLSREYLDPKVEPIVGSQGIACGQARLYDIARFPLSYFTTCKEMSVSKPRGRGKSYQRRNFHWYEQPMGQG